VYVYIIFFMIGLHCANACISNQRFAQSQYFVLPSCSGVSADNKKVKGKKRSENGHKHIYST
jgi:hypothetical protein